MDECLHIHHTHSLPCRGPIPPKVKSTTCQSGMKLSSSQSTKRREKNKYTLIRLDECADIHSSPRTFIDTLSHAASPILKWSLRVMS